ncbi:MAG TPA: 4Fe-4S dicluster domain-containing protein [Firmicutes bacterium]|nr:4Fe-4S dicluster domain-containing protein [Bacillota bacterium]HHY99007.1 4Fe-4S dicluster domain-containing protein [Bacillota bacterium]
MPSRFHSVYLIEEKCRGCTNCIKRCPTEAIRVREGKARINADRCTDCGECVRTCDNHAKATITDNLDSIRGFKYSIAMPAPSFYSQFYEIGKDKDHIPEKILGALLRMGFDDVFDVARAADIMSYVTRVYVKEHPGGRPFISPACPAVVRLIQVRFPSLLDRIVPVDAPARAAGKLARKKAVAELHLAPEDVGTFFITPCPAKMTWVRDLLSIGINDISGAIAASAIYSEIKRNSDYMNNPGIQYTSASSFGLGWGSSGGENRAVALKNSLVVDGIHNVIAVLEEMELGKLDRLDFIEAQACVGGCVGGALMVRNPFLGRVALEQLASSVGRKDDRPYGGDETKDNGGYLHDDYFPLPETVGREIHELYRQGYFNGAPLVPQPAFKLDEDLARAIAKMERMEQVLESLPGLDCGSCGSPNCRALAEDIVQGLAVETDCVFKLREQIKALAEELFHLAQKDPSAIGKK